MSQEVPEQAADTETSLQSFGSSALGVGSAAVKPLVGGYNLSKSVVDAIVPGQLLRNLGEMAEAAIGLRDGVHPLKIEKKSAKIDVFDQDDPWN
jgi:hypothetical protein